MSRLPISLTAAVLAAASPFALSAAVGASPPAAADRGGDEARPCAPFSDDGSTLRRGLEPNLERGGRAATEAFRVTIDGAAPAPGGEAAAGRADAQRATDVALSRDDLIVQVTRLDAQPMLSLVPARPVAAPGSVLRIETLATYAAFITGAELRVLRAGDSADATPLTTLPVRLGEPTLWAVPEDLADPHVRLVLRVTDARRRFDETAPVELRITTAPVDGAPDQRHGPVFENMRVVANIPVRGAEVTLSGRLPDPAATVMLFGTRVPVDRSGRFVARQIVPPDVRQPEVGIAAPGGEARTIVRALDLPTDDHFLVEIADVTAGHRSMNADRRILQGADQGDAWRDFADGRLAFYYRGVLSDRWRLTASTDTGEQKLSDLFDGFLKRDPRSLLRRLDPERHYPVHGDDSVTVDDAPTYGRFYVRSERDTAEAMWGNFQTSLTGSELIRYQRGLYGAQLKLRNPDATRFRERRTEVTGFAADPGTIGACEDFASTGGSVYYLRNRDLAPGSERLFVEVRDRDSGLVIERRELAPARDYEVNHIQGRVLLREALPIVADGSLWVQNASLAGNPVWLVATCEYVPGLTRPDALTISGRAQHWLSDTVRLAVTGYHQGEDQAAQDLYGADILIRGSATSCLRAEVARSKGRGTQMSLSSTGATTLPGSRLPAARPTPSGWKARSMSGTS